MRATIFFAAFALAGNVHAEAIRSMPTAVPAEADAFSTTPDVCASGYVSRGIDSDGDCIPAIVEDALTNGSTNAQTSNAGFDADAAQGVLIDALEASTGSIVVDVALSTTALQVLIDALEVDTGTIVVNTALSTTALQVLIDALEVDTGTIVVNTALSTTALQVLIDAIEVDTGTLQVDVALATTTIEGNMFYRDGSVAGTGAGTWVSSWTITTGDGGGAPRTRGLVVQDLSAGSVPGISIIAGTSGRTELGFGAVDIGQSSGRIVHDENGDLHFLTNNTTQQTILDGGNVGINDASPAEKLDVDGNINLTGSLKLDDAVAFSSAPVATLAGYNSTLGAGTTFQAMVPDSAIKLLRMTATVVVAGTGGAGDTFYCGENANNISVTVSAEATAGTVTTSKAATPISVAMGATVYQWMESGASPTPTVNVVCEYGYQ